MKQYFGFWFCWPRQRCLQGCSSNLLDCNLTSLLQWNKKSRSRCIIFFDNNGNGHYCLRRRNCQTAKNRRDTEDARKMVIIQTSILHIVAVKLWWQSSTFIYDQCKPVHCARTGDKTYNRKTANLGTGLGLNSWQTENVINRRKQICPIPEVSIPVRLQRHARLTFTGQCDDTTGFPTSLRKGMKYLPHYLKLTSHRQKDVCSTKHARITTARVWNEISYHDSIMSIIRLRLCSDKTLMHIAIVLTGLTTGVHSNGQTGTT